MSRSTAPRRGAVSSPHPMATEAGLKVLRAGGNAAEAAVATGAALAVLCPHFCGLGGDGVWMLGDDAGMRLCILGLGHAGEAVPMTGTPVPQRGPGAMLTTAGLIPSWEALLEVGRTAWNGDAPLAPLLSDAVTWAEQGIAVTASHRFWLSFRAAEFGDWPGFARSFLPAGRMPDIGERFRQPGLAAILTILQDEGLDSFRTGTAARRVAAGLSAAGAPLTAADLAATRAQVVTPLAMPVAGWTLFAPPAPTQGATTLTIMALLDRLGAAGLDPDGAGALHLRVEAVKQAFALRGAIADPALHPVPGLPCAAALDRMAADVPRRRATPWPHPFAPADTVYLAVTDAAGHHVSALQSTYFDWGSGVPVGDTGILWNNRGAAFGPSGSGVNGLAPGARPFHTLNPGMAFGPAGEALLYGTQGADGQPQTLAVLLDRMLFHGEPPERALAAPRFLLGRTFSDSEDTLKVEESAGRPVLEALRRMGHPVEPLPPLSPLAGQAGAILVDARGQCHAAHDPRGEGTAGLT